MTLLSSFDDYKNEYTESLCADDDCKVLFGVAFGKSSQLKHQVYFEI